ncbi:MAG: hypothetical protein HW416_1489 [Chloroflexi bacterium]|nr:hypothetical protein [Chloroflexota bacterium]
MGRARRLAILSAKRKRQQPHGEGDHRSCGLLNGFSTHHAGLSMYELHRGDAGHLELELTP